MQFSSRFKQLCKERNITQKKALEDMGFHRNAAQRWADGSPSTDALLKIAEYFGITTDEVLGKETKKAPTPKGERDYLAIMNAFDQADESTREAILLLLKLK
jgi:transcriptional regulator with XRE-family HTH domain